MFGREPDLKTEVQNLGSLPLKRDAPNCVFWVILRRHRNFIAFILGVK